MAKEISRRLDEISEIIDDKKLAKVGYDYFIRKTPYRSGNARRSTQLRDNNIQANYPYAGRLDQGYSPKAPDGMTEPTIKHLQDYVQSRLRK